MTTVAAAMTKARGFLAFVGVLSLLGLDWTAWTRIVVGVALVLAVAIDISADGHRIWPGRIRTARYDKAA
ncbi:hypothetical protein OG749_36225 [Streptomyces nojiriensis]|uniref:hypothetical protein n=1 Tax=Streptomyces nojiriensis TaxID=66374 RepID=UPI002E18375E